MERKIGVIDSGIGGLTVVKALQKLLPNEEIIYFGDNKNNPYGNRSDENIKYLTYDILEFMEKKDVKVVALACNTISTIFHGQVDTNWSFPIVDIITPTVDHIKNMGVDNLGIFGTKATIRSKTYEKLLEDENIQIVTEASRDLASLIDQGLFDSKKVRDTIKEHMDTINKKKDIYNIVLACTHYPIVENIFYETYPQLNYINPAYQQTKAIKTYLIENNLLNLQGNGSIEIMTSGDIEIYEKVVEKLALRNLNQISTINLV